MGLLQKSSSSCTGLFLFAIALLIQMPCIRAKLQCAPNESYVSKTYNGPWQNLKCDDSCPSEIQTQCQADNNRVVSKMKCNWWGYRPDHNTEYALCEGCCGESLPNPPPVTMECQAGERSKIFTLTAIYPWSCSPCEDKCKAECESTEELREMCAMNWKSDAGGDSTYTCRCCCKMNPPSPPPPPPSPPPPPPSPPPPPPPSPPPPSPSPPPPSPPPPPPPSPPPPSPSPPPPSPPPPPPPSPPPPSPSPPPPSPPPPSPCAPPPSPPSCPHPEDICDIKDMYVAFHLSDTHDCSLCAHHCEKKCSKLDSALASECCMIDTSSVKCKCCCTNNTPALYSSPSTAGRFLSFIIE